MSSGFVFQFGQLVPELSAVKNVATPLLSDSAGSCSAFSQGARAMVGR
jgi:predicted ABC-type transport system involved in lysophospholipase L1 biosynthesis ATPase subunit